MISRDEVPYKLFSLSSGILGGALAGVIVTRIWRAFAGTDEVPDPTVLDFPVRKVLIAGAIQGVIFGVVKAALSRMTAKGYQQFTGTELKSIVR
jgi:hypothetical protein